MTRPTDKKPARPATSGSAAKDGDKGKKPYKRGMRPHDIKRDQQIKEGETRPGDRIAKVLARAGVASRRDAEVIVTEGRVSVNGRVIKSPAFNVLPKDRITLDGHELREAEPPRLWLYHKPTGLVTTNKDEKGRDTVFDALPKDLPRVMSVGRLDINSEGLLLLTNDGDLKRKLELPDTGWLRKYRVRVKGTASEATLDKLRKGITADGEDFQPMEVVFDRQQGANAWLTVGLREGKNREIRRAMEEIGLVVNRLIRISYGPFRLNNIKSGEVEEVRPRVLRDQLGIETDEYGKPKREVSRGGRDDKGGRDKRPFDKDRKPFDKDKKPFGKRDEGRGDREDRPYRKRDGDDRGGFKGKRDGDDRGGFKGKRDGERGFKKRDDDKRGGEKRFGDKRGGDKRFGDKREDGKRGSGGEGRRDGKPGGFKSHGFKSHGGGKGSKPRSAGFKSHGGGSDKPHRGGSDGARGGKSGGSNGPARGGKPKSRG